MLSWWCTKADKYNGCACTQCTFPIQDYSENAKQSKKEINWYETKSMIA